MYILVRESDQIIVGTATRAIDASSTEKNGIKVYEILDSEFKPKMLGSRLVSFDKVDK